MKVQARNAKKIIFLDIISDEFKVRHPLLTLQLLSFMIWTFHIITAGHSSYVGLAQRIPKANLSVKTQLHGLLSVNFFQQSFTV